MMFDSPIPFGARRETRSYASILLDAAEAAAEGTAADRLSGAVEGCAGLWERAFASAECPRLTATQLALMGRSLMLTGEALFVREGSGVGSPANTYTLEGRQSNPSRWRYRLDLPYPTTTKTVTRAGSDVLHVRIGATRERPYKGRSPLSNSEATAAILAALEASLKFEASGPVATLIPVPDPERSGTVPDDIAKARGRAVLVETTQSGGGEGYPARPARDWQGSRLGPNMPSAEVESRRDVERSVAAACGVPPVLLGLAGPGSADSRESWRQFVFATIQPIARIIEAELDRIGLAGTVSFERLAASDISGRARAFGSLTKGGMDSVRAAEIVGFSKP